MAGVLPGRHGGAVKLGKGRRIFAQRRGQAVAFHHPRAHRQQHRLDLRRGGLRGRRAQGFLDGQRSLHQRRQLPGDQCQITRRQAAAETEAATADVFLGLGLLHLQRRPLLLAQQLPRLTRAVGLDQALLLTATGVEGEVFEGSHQAVSNSGDPRSRAPLHRYRTAERAAANGATIRCRSGCGCLCRRVGINLIPSLLTRHPQHFLDGGHPLTHLAQPVLADARA